MKSPFHVPLTIPVLLAIASIAPAAHAQQNIQIQVHNNQTDGGFFLTPLWFGVHDGSFDLFDGNNSQTATPGLERIAEEGDASILSNEFSTLVPDGQQGVIISPGGFAGAPVIDPGESPSTTITIGDPSSNRFFSFASMVIPSNDAFIGNDSPSAYQLFDSNGDFTGPVTIQLFGSDIWDAGTEVNDPNAGAAFSANGGTGIDESLFVRVHPGLGNFVGTFTVAGTEITSDIGGAELLATITISAVPEPGSMAFLVSGTVLAFFHQRSRRV